MFIFSEEHWGDGVKDGPGVSLPGAVTSVHHTQQLNLR